METELQRSLNHYFGFNTFRSGQEQVISQLLDGKSSLAIFPTGSGKSLCYQLAAMHLPALTLVVSPLLALMKDQQAFLSEKGIASVCIDSTMSADENRQAMADIKSGKIKILMISVERFKNERFRTFIQSINVSMLVVDEAHCISEWGHNFRPDYLKLPAYCQQLQIPLVLLLTATATRKVKNDMAAKFNICADSIVRTGFYRKNLQLSILPTAERDKEAMLVEQVAQCTGAGIVYVTLQKTAEALAELLVAQGFNASAYHAGMADDQRKHVQTCFMQDEINIVVATIAFGMGIDKSNVRFVLHYDFPKSIENYSQEIGRAGRDGKPSVCITLANLDGLNTVENFIYSDTPERESIKYIIQDIDANRVNNEWEVKLYNLSNESNIKQLTLKTLLVQLEILKVIEPKYTYFSEYKYKFILNEDVIISKFKGERAEFVKNIIETTKFKRVWGEPDLEVMYSVFSMERARVITALNYLAEQGWIELAVKGMTEAFEVLDLERLKGKELIEYLQTYFNDKECSEIERIDSLVKFFELDRCLSHHLAEYFDDINAPTSCGHCSVCSGRVAQLAYTSDIKMPDETVLVGYLKGLKQHMASQGVTTLSVAICSKFLAGMTMPLFTKCKVRKLAGFGCCEAIRYKNIYNLCERIGAIS